MLRKQGWKRWLWVMVAGLVLATLLAGCTSKTTEKYPPEDKAAAVFGYYWAPTALMGMYDWYILEEPEYDPDIWAKITAAKDDPSLRPLSEACAYETVPITKGVWSGLKDMAPDVYEMLKKMVIGLEPINRTAAWAKAHEVQNWEDAAIWYLQNFEERWKQWVTPEAYEKVKAALAGNPTAPSPEKPTILFGDAQFESIWINNAIAEYIVKYGYGYPAESVQMTTVVWQVALPKGDIHVQLELWKQNLQDWFNEQIAKGTIEELGMTYEGGPQFFIIPQWVHEKYNINTIFDMKDHWELFQDPEDPSKGAFYNCIIGWQCAAINEVKLEAYGLTDYYNIISPGSSGALEAALAGPQKRYQARQQ